MEAQTETEATISEDALTASLGELLKAADAEDVVEKLKKGGYAFSGHDDERGHSSGGAGSEKDAGGIETMMIGKLVAAGMGGDQARAAVGTMMGYLSDSGLIGKAKAKGDEDEDEDEDEEDEDMTAYARGFAAATKEMKAKGYSKSEDEEESEDESDEKMQKSFTDEFKSDSDIAQAVDASPFMEALTVRVTGALDSLRKSLTKQEGNQAAVNKALAGALYQQGMLVKSQSKVIDELGKRLGIVERQPASKPKGVTSTPEAMKKSFDGGGTGEERLTKSEMAAAISYLRFQKGMTDIEGQEIGQAACFVESGGVLHKSVAEYVERWLAAHPNERNKALNYR